MRDYLAKKADGLASAVSGTIGGIIGSQAPAFYNQYLDTVAGAKAGVGKTVNNLRESIANSGGNLDSLIEKLKISSDPEMASLGQACCSNVRYFDRLKNMYESLANAQIFEKPIEFLKNIDVELFSETLANYTPAIQLTLEGFGSALGGVGAAFGCYKLAKFGLKSCYKGVNKMIKRTRATKISEV